MNKVKKIVLIIAVFLFALPGNGYSADESVLFTSVPPDALIVLDLSGSMDWNPAGGSNIYGVSSCAPDTTACSGTGCSGGYCSASKTGCSTNCSRLNIAKRAIFNMLDDTNDNTIRSTGANTDDNSLNIRIGYMNFCGGNDTDGDYNSGNVRLRRAIGTSYSRIFCDNADTCNMSSITDSGSCTARVDNTQAHSGTPLSSSLMEAKSYLDFHKAADSARDCRDKYVILISDGADTYICGGTGAENVADMYRRRRETVARAKALGDAGYKVFVIGFGAGMPLALRNTLNLAAYYGGTDNPLETNSGSTTGYNIQECNPKPCIAPLYPTGVTSCQTDAPVPTTRIHNIAGYNGDVGDTVANSNDPATANLSGYAFIAGDADQLTQALRQAVNIIRSARYSFTNVSISAARITSENHLYEASFTPIDDEPFWKGQLKKFNINADGTIGSQVWDAGAKLAARAASTRNIKTLIGGSITDFSTSISRNYFAVATDAKRDEIVGYIRGESAYNQDFWKLGDIWHSSPTVITSPSPYFRDAIDANNAFATYRENNQRTSANGRRIVMAGANDGQLHVFRTSDGEETFSFIPPNMLPKLQLISHTTHPTLLTHQFFVDGPISAADVWLGSGSGTSKSASDWKTMVVFGLGRGANDYSGSTLVRPYLWSASPNCIPIAINTVSSCPLPPSATPIDPNFDPRNHGYCGTYTSTTPYYCGYYAFDFTNTLNPSYKWRLNPSSSDAPYLGDPWSKMAIGRVKIGGQEKWVGFIGGGGYEYSCSTAPPDPGDRGKGFFVVDLSNGDIIWRYTKATNSSMNYAIPAPPAIVDMDNDGFIDTAYVGDLGGNMWRFRFCDKNDKNLGSTCTSTSHWSGGLFYDASAARRPIYTGASIVKDKEGNFWVYWGTGDKQCPAVRPIQERFYALKDNDRTATYTLANTQDITSGTYSGSNNGWRIMLANASGEKVLSEPAIFAGTLLFTTFIPADASANPCLLGGTGKIYGVHYITGAGALSGGARSSDLGTGIPSAPLVSLRPDRTGVDVHTTLSGGAGIDSRTILPPGVNLTLPSNMSNILFWRDRRVQ